MKKSYTTTLLILLLLVSGVNVVTAQDTATPSASDDEVTENLKERLKQTVGISEVQGEEKSIRGYVGVVKDVIKNTLVVDDKDGKKNITINSDTTIVRTPGNTKIEISNVRIDDQVIAIGYPQGSDQDELQGKRIIVSTTPFTPPEKLSQIGKVVDIGKYAFTITPLVGDNDVEIFFTKSTIYKDKDSMLEFEDIQQGDEVLFTAVRDKDDDWSATIVMRLKQAK